VVVGRISSCKKAVKALVGVPMVFISETDGYRKDAFDLGCIDFMLESEVDTLVSKLVTYARMSCIRKTLEKLLAKPL
jgi:hypothetical protein